MGSLCVAPNNGWFHQAHCRLGRGQHEWSGRVCSAANLRTRILDFRGFDSSIILILRGGILRSMGIFPEVFNQPILAGIILVGVGWILLNELRCRHFSDSCINVSGGGPPCRNMQNPIVLKNRSSVEPRNLPAFSWFFVHRPVTIYTLRRWGVAWCYIRRFARDMYEQPASAVRCDMVLHRVFFLRETSLN